MAMEVVIMVGSNHGPVREVVDLKLPNEATDDDIRQEVISYLASRGLPAVDRVGAYFSRLKKWRKVGI